MTTLVLHKLQIFATYICNQLGSVNSSPARHFQKNRQKGVILVKLPRFCDVVQSIDDGFIDGNQIYRYMSSDTRISFGSNIGVQAYKLYIGFSSNFRLSLAGIL